MQVDSDESFEQTPKPPAIVSWSPQDTDFGAAIGDESINGLMNSMLQEASSHSPEPLTPVQHTMDFANNRDIINGGEEDGVPHGRNHRSDRNRLQRDSLLQRKFEDKDLPGTPESDAMADAEDEPSFSSISLSTPPRQPSINASRHAPPALPPGTEVEDGMPLGRSHHAERALKAHQEDDPEIDKDVKMLPPSPSPLKRSAPGKKIELHDGMVPRFDLGIGLPTTLRKDEYSHALTDGK